MKSDKKTILFVEDNPLVLMIYRNWLQRDGFQVESAEDGQVALDKLLQLKPDLVILDLMLPKVNGLDVLKFIRGHDDLKTTPVMILSNAYLDEPALKAMNAGANKRMLKTQCTPAKLTEAVREVLGVAANVRGPGRLQSDSTLAEAHEALLAETRNSLLEDAPEEIAQIREHCLAFVKAAGLPASAEHLNNMYQQVRFLCTRAGLGDCAKVAHLVSALEALLYEISLKKALPSSSVLQTIAQAVDCLGRLFRKGDIQSLETVLKAKVLIADDDPICNFATMAAMKRAKLEAVCTQDPLQLLEMAKAKTYDIVLLDINMPGMNGFEVCEKLRLLPEYKKTPVVFVTSNSEFQNRAQAVLSGGNDLIAKPIFPLELALKTIMHLIEPKEQARTARPRPETKAPPADMPIAPSVVRQITQQPPPPAPPVTAPLKMVESEEEDVPVSPPVVPVIPMAPVMERPIAAPTNGDLNRVGRNGNGSAHAGDFPAPVLFAPEPAPVSRVTPPQNGANHGVPVDNRNGKPPLDHMAREVTRILFGDEGQSDMHLRLTRIALERYNVPEIMSRAAAAGANGEPFKQVTREISRIIFGDEGQSDMHLRLTRIALERYNIPEIMNRTPEVNGRNGSANGSVNGSANGSVNGSANGSAVEHSPGVVINF